MTMVITQFKPPGFRYPSDIFAPQNKTLDKRNKTKTQLTVKLVQGNINVAEKTEVQVGCHL